MTKTTWKPGTMLFPVPPVMVTCGTSETANVLTIAWTGIINSEPPITYISVRPSRFSHKIIAETKEFVINITNLPLAKACDFCGVKSGKSTDKFKEMGLELEPSTKIKTPMLKSAPVSLECKVLEIKSFGTHDMFIAEIVAVNVDDKYIEDDGSVTLFLNEIPLVENAATEEEAIEVLANSILEYAVEFYDNFNLWASAPNKKSEIPYVFKALILDDISKIGAVIKCQAGEI